MRRPILVLLFACGLLVATCVPASATDATVEQAWHGDDAQFTKVGKQFSKGVRIWVKSGNRKPGRALRANRKTQRLLKGLLKRTDKVAARSRKRSKRARKLFRQAEREAAAPTG